ncbi:MAG: hypothetical protein ACLFUS_16925 [Candidatus Sumerlaeia bacterium]
MEDKHQEEEPLLIASFTQPMEAHMARIQLDAEDIPSYIADENLATIQPLYSDAIGGVKLFVPRSHARRAAEILGVPDQTLNDTRIKVCDQCGSRNIRSHPSPILLLVFGLLTLGVTSLCIRRKHKCLDCGFTW